MDSIDDMVPFIVPHELQSDEIRRLVRSHLLAHPGYDARVEYYEEINHIRIVLVVPDGIAHDLAGAARDAGIQADDSLVD